MAAQIIPHDGPGIYSITCTADFSAPYGGWKYFGQAVNVMLRVHGHFCQIRNGWHPNGRLGAAVRLHGYKAFEATLLEILPLMASRSEMAAQLNAAEQRYLDAHMGSRCFNWVARAYSILDRQRYKDHPWPPALSARAAAAGSPN